jgi:chemotaxis protein histidine kinase CheA
VLSPKGISSEELGHRFDVLLQTLATCVDRTDIVCSLFEFLAMVADRKAVKDRCARTEDTELIHLVGHALEIHQKDRSVQRAGLQLYEAILNNATEKSQKAFAKKIFRAVGENLQRNSDEPAICFSSYSILCTLCDKMGDKLGPWVDRILGMVLTTISQLYSAELVAQCLLLVEKLAADEESLFVMAAHQRCLLVFTDALSILTVRHLSAAVTALEYLLRILEDETSMQIVFENLKDKQRSPGSFFLLVSKELASKSERFAQAVQESGSQTAEEAEAMQYWLQLLEASTNLLSDMVDANPLSEAEEAEEQAPAGSAAQQAPSTGSAKAAPEKKGKDDFANVNPLNGAKADQKGALSEAPAASLGQGAAQALGATYTALDTTLTTATTTTAANSATTSVDADLAAQLAATDPAELPHRRRSFVYEEPDPSADAGAKAQTSTAAPKDKVVGSAFTPLAAAATTAGPSAITVSAPNVAGPASSPSPAPTSGAASATATAAAPTSGQSSKMGSGKASSAGIKWETLGQQEEVSLRSMCFGDLATSAIKVCVNRQRGLHHT